MSERTPTITAARYAKGKVVMVCPSDGSGYKTRAARLAEAFGGRWVNRSHGYVMSPNRAIAAMEHWKRGYDAHIRMFVYDTRKTNELLIPPQPQRATDTEISDRLRDEITNNGEC